MAAKGSVWYPHGLISSLGYSLALTRPEPQVSSVLHTHKTPLLRRWGRRNPFHVWGMWFQSCEGLYRSSPLHFKNWETCSLKRWGNVPKVTGPGKNTQRALTPPTQTSFILTNISDPSACPSLTPTTPQQEQSGSSKPHANANGFTDLRLYSHCFPQT